MKTIFTNLPSFIRLAFNVYRHRRGEAHLHFVRVNPASLFLECLEKDTQYFSEVAGLTRTREMRTLFYSTQTVDSNLVGNAKAPSVPAQRVITAHLMSLWPSHQYVIGDISLTRSEQTLGLQSSQPFKACPADPDDTIFGHSDNQHALLVRFG